MSKKRKLILSIIIFLIVFGVTECIVRSALPEVPASSQAFRNPFRFRGWPEFMRESSEDRKRTQLVLISNSQAAGREYHAKRIYPAYLERFLNERRVGGKDDWEVLNWSSDGMTSMEYCLMAAMLQQRSPELVLAVTGFADFKMEHYHEDFGHCRTDIPRLLSRWDVVRRLPGSFWRRHIGMEAALSAAVSDRIAMLRYPDYLWSLLDRIYPGAQKLFYAPHLNYHPWEVEAEARTKKLHYERTREATPRFTYAESSADMLAEYLDVLGDIESPVVFVSQPIQPNREGDRRMENHVRFQADAERLTAEKTVAFWDMHAVMPSDAFITSSHFRQPAHKAFAERLVERIETLYQE